VHFNQENITCLVKVFIGRGFFAATIMCTFYVVCCECYSCGAQWQSG